HCHDALGPHLLPYGGRMLLLAQTIAPCAAAEGHRVCAGRLTHFFPGAARTLAARLGFFFVPTCLVHRLGRLGCHHEVERGKEILDLPWPRVPRQFQSREWTLGLGVYVSCGALGRP